jgi:hypothetical protein
VTAAEQDLRDAVAALHRRSRLTRIELKIRELVHLLEVGIDTKAELAKLEKWRKECETDMRSRGQQP